MFCMCLYKMYLCVDHAVVSIACFLFWYYGTSVKIKSVSQRPTEFTHKYTKWPECSVDGFKRIRSSSSLFNPFGGAAAAGNCPDVVREGATTGLNRCGGYRP